MPVRRKREPGLPITDTEWQLVRDVIERAILRAEARKAPGEQTRGESGEVPKCAKHNTKLADAGHPRIPNTEHSREFHSTNKIKI